MRFVVWLTAVLFVAYSGYWVVGSRAARSGAEAALVELRGAGRADFASVTIAGFPSRFDLTISEPRLTDRASGLAWSAPFLQVLALSYRPNQMIVVWPDDQTLTVGSATVGLTTEDLRASVTVGASTALPLDRLTLVGQAPRAAWAGGSVAADELRFATARVPAAPGAPANAHRLGLAVTGLRLPGDRLPAALQAVPAAIGLDAVAAFAAPVDRTALDGLPPLTRLSLAAATIAWGAVTGRATGEVSVTPAGRPEGRIDVTIAGWRTALEAAEAFRLIRPEIAPTVGNVLETLSRGTPNPDEIRIPVDFRSGLVFLGPLPLGPAPVLPGYRQ